MLARRYLSRVRIPSFFALLVLLSSWSCGGGAPKDGGLFRGVFLSPGIPKPDFTLTDFNGEPYSFAQRTAGKVALLFFGYTHCPDVCPLHAANVAAVLKQMPFAEREKVVFVFVTTDPERDTPGRLKSWLGAFDPTFVGLAGPAEEVARIGASVGVSPARRELPQGADSAGYLVGHGAQVIAFGVDGVARTEYPFGVRQEDWAYDLPRLARGELPPTPPNAPPAPGPDAGIVSAARGPTIRVEGAVMPAPVSATEAAVYLTIVNGDRSDTLTHIWSPGAASAGLHESVAAEGRARMRAAAPLVIAPNATISLRPGERHIMLMNLSRVPVAGESFPLQLRFAQSGDYVLTAQVIPYAELDAHLREKR